MLDSNLIIYCVRPEYAQLRQLFPSHALAVSAITVVEVLGYHKLSSTERSLLEAFFAVLEVLPLTEPVVTGAVSLRQARKMSLGDALIAATALEFGRELLTRNTKDFANIPGLVITDPLAS